MKKVMTTVLGVVAAMMVFSLAACTPTEDKNKTEAATEAVVKETQAEAVKEETKAEETKAEETKTGETKAKAKASIATEKMPAFDAPALEVVSIYTVSEDGGKLEGTMDAVEELNAQSLVDLLVQYGVLEEGTTVNSFSVDTEAASQKVGPGTAGPGGEAQSSAGGQSVLDLNKFPSENADLCMQAVVNTFIENMDVTYMTISVDGTVVYENMAIAE